MKVLQFRGSPLIFSISGSDLILHSVAMLHVIHVLTACMHSDYEKTLASYRHVQFVEFKTMYKCISKEEQ